MSLSVAPGPCCVPNDFRIFYIFLGPYSFETPDQDKRVSVTPEALRVPLVYSLKNVVDNVCLGDL